MKSTNKSSKKMKIAMSFLFAAVLLQIITMNVDALCDGKLCTSDTDCANNPPCLCRSFPWYVDPKSPYDYKACCGVYNVDCDPIIKDSCCHLRSCDLVSSNPDDYKCRCVQKYNDLCNPNYENACCKEEGLVCIEVSPGVFKCKDELCEEHAGHECYPGLFECCEDSGLSCVLVDPSTDSYQCM